MPARRSSTTWMLHRDGVIRIYDVLFDYNVLLDTDAFVREVIQGPEFQRPMGTDEFHYLLGKYVAERGRKLEPEGQLGPRDRLRVRHPDLHQQPGRQLHRHERRRDVAARFASCMFDVNRDVNQTAAHRLRSEVHRRTSQRVHPRRRFAEKFHAPDRAADPGSHGHRRKRATITFCNAPTRAPTRAA